MKRVLFFTGLFMMLLPLCGFTQNGPVLLTHVDFENGIPAGWTVSDQSNVFIYNDLAATGEKSLRMKPTAGEIMITSPEFTIQPGCATRLEFSHIPILNNQNGGRVEVLKPNGTWTPLTLQNPVNPSCYDPSYGSGASGFDGSFKKVSYWTGNSNIDVADLDSTYWRNEVFYLYSTLTSSATTVKFRFVLPASSGAAANFSGWFIDDVRLYVASVAGDEVRIPQIRSVVKAPNISNYPTCSDVLVQMQIRDAGGAMSTAADAVKIEFKQADDNGVYSTTEVNMTLVDAANSTYEGNIPFNGFGKTTYWKVLAKDAKGNEVRYPFVYGTYNRYTIIRPYEGTKKIKETQTSNQELMIPTNKLASMFQMRYTAEELREAGFGAGEIGGLYYNVTQSAAGFVMPNFSLSIGNIDPAWVLDQGYLYSATTLTRVYSNPSFVAPPIGEHYIQFDEPFLWDGESDIMIKTCWGPAPSAGGTTKVECISTTGNNRTGQFTQTGTSYLEACSAPFNTADGMVNYKVNYKFDFLKNCVLPVDAALSEKLATPANQKISANTNSNFGVYLRNDGSEPLSQVKVSFLADNGSTGNATWNGTLDPGDSTIFNVTSSLNLPAGYRHVTAWTNVLPPDIDWNTLNDTITYDIISCDGAMNGVYAIGNVQGVPETRTFDDFSQAFKVLEVCGVGAPVTIKVEQGADGVRGDILKFPTTIQGASATNMITFTSSTNEPVRFYVNDTVRANTSFDLSGCKYMRFENLTFLPAKSYMDNNSVAMSERSVVKLSQTSNHIEFKKCNFPSSITFGTEQTQSVCNLKPTAILDLSAASNVTIDSCCFSAVADKVVNIKGLSPTSMTNGIVIKNTTFDYEPVSIGGSQTVSDNIIYAEYNDGLIVSRNVFNSAPDITTVGGEKYAIMLQASKNFDINKNIFDLEKITAISLSQIGAGNSKIANNKISIKNSNEGVVNIHLSGIKFLSGENVSIVYNNIYASDAGITGKQATALSLGSQGQTSSGVVVKNNIVVSEGMGFAIWERTSENNASTSFTLSNNMYYKVAGSSSDILFKFNTNNVATTEQWETISGETNSYYTENPFFMAWNNLHTTSTFVCYKGTPIAGVTDDFFGRSRPTSNTCIGALEFEPPTSNIFVTSVEIGSGDYSEVDGMPAYSSCDFGQETVSVRYKNISSNTIPANTARMYYKVDNGVAVNGGLISHAIAPNTDYVFTFTQSANLAAVSADTRMILTAFSSLAADTVNTNDTTRAVILSNYQLPALANQSTNVNYGTSANISVSSNDSIYWFKSMDDDVPFLKSHNLTTTQLYADTAFYFSAKREIPVLKITELQFNKNASVENGITTPLPSWVTTNNAYEISNFGNGSIDLTGYSFVYYSGNNTALSTSPTKTYTFPAGYVLEANQSVVLLPVNANAVTAEGVLGIASGTVGADKKTGYLLKNAAGTVIDAVAVNGATFAAGHNVPASVWQGSSANLTLTNTAGIVRKSAAGSTQAAWEKASSTSPMTIGTYNDELTVHTDNGCLGHKATYNVVIQNAPTYNPSIVAVSVVGLSADSACTLNEEQIKVKITNLGLQPVTNIPIQYYSKKNNAIFQQKNDTYTGTINPFDTIEYTLTETLDLSAVSANETFEITALANLAADNIHGDDTARMQVVSLMTPQQPAVQDVNIPYASSTVLTATSTNTLVWYDSPTSHQELSRGTYTTPVLYETDTFYVAALLAANADVEIGTGTSTNTNDNAPTPFAFSKKQVKEQYLWRAEELSDMGEGLIKSIGFKVHSEGANVTMSDYAIKIGMTNDNVLTTWVGGLQEVYSDNVTITKTPAMTNVWKDMTFVNPFYYDGESNLVVEICYNTTVTTGKVKTYNSNTEFNSAIIYHDNNTNACQYTGNPGATYAKRPNVKFGLDKYGCKSERAALVVEVQPAPACEVGLTRIVSPVAGTTLMSGEIVPIEVEIKNFGTTPLETLDLHCWVDGSETSVYTWTGYLPQDSTTTCSPLTYGSYTSGVTQIKVWLEKDCDNEPSNDTVETNLMICTGNTSGLTTITVGNEGEDISDVLDELTSSGICGPVQINVSPGTYYGQINISNIAGLSETNYIKFVGLADDNSQVVLTYNAIIDVDKHVLSLSDVENIHFENMTIQCADTTADVSVLVENSKNVSFRRMNFVSPKTARSTMLSIANTDDILISENDFVGSAIQLATADSIMSLSVRNNNFFNFGVSGIRAYDVEGLTIEANHLSTDTSKLVVTAIDLKRLTGASNVTSNFIYLTKGTAVRTGISMKEVHAEQIQPAIIANNSISMIGARNSSSSLAYIGIDIDSTDWLSLYYNTVYLEPSKGNNTSSKCLAVGKVGSNIIVQNNNLDNSGKGYAMYVQTPATHVVLSNNNNYYTNGSKFVYWINDKSNLTLLQTANSMDAQSVSIENSFKNDSVLALTFPTGIVRIAEPVDDVATDIEGNFRPVSPKPTIGAYEYQFAGNDTGIPRIISPVEGDEYVEGDPLSVEVELKNFGNYSINTMEIVAVLKSSEDSETAIQTLRETWTGMLSSLQTTTYTFNQTFTPPLNDPYTDELYVMAYTIMDGDTVHINDTAYTHFLSKPAKDLKLEGTVPITERCVLTNVQIQTKIKNVGEKNIEPGDVIQLSYWIEGRPDLTQTETLTFPYTDQTTQTPYQNLQKGASLTYTFNATANLYPLGANDTTWKLWTCVKTVGDNQQLNDTASAAKVVNSKVSPPAPTVTDDYIPYATWGHPSAEQANSLAIKWYAGPNDANPFYAPTNYNTSRNYTTSQLFEDTTFYVGVNATGTYPCASERTAVTVHVNPRAAVDASALAVVYPPEDAWVYMSTGDTIKVLLTNYGTQPLSNFPVTYSIKPTSPANAEPVIVTETCTATVQPDEQYTYTFETLADMSGLSKNYSIMAWTDAAGDITALNDTTKAATVVKPKNGNTVYCSITVDNPASLDISRVQLGVMDNPTTPSGNGYSDFTTDTTITMPTLYRGVADQLNVHVDNSTSMDANSVVGGWVRVFIDWDRNGEFSAAECVVSDTVYSGMVLSKTLNVPANTLNGIARMRVILKQSGTSDEFTACEKVQRGEVEDYRVIIKPAEQINAELKRFTSPSELASAGQTDVKVVLRNAGLQTLNSATITLKHNDQDYTYNWTGNLASGELEEITIANVDLDLGANNFKAYIDVAGDNVHDNDTINLNSYVFRTFVVPYQTDFDEEDGNDHFYAYDANPTNPTNSWQFGTPAETNTTIDVAYSEPNCWKTNLSGKHPKNNESILYSPIFDVNTVKPDTMSFMLRTDAGVNTASMHIEYLNWQGKWVLLGAKEDGYGENWYNSDSNYFNGTKSWTKVTYSLEHVNYLFGNNLQFRFVFRSNAGVQKDGFAIDNFEIQRAKREQDAGVVSLTLEPTALPNYGSNYYPRVGIHNYGTTSLTNLQVCYISEGLYIPICEDLIGVDIQPETTYEYTFNTGTYLTVDSPDPFGICAFTRLNPTDIYTDNDSVCQQIVIGPLQKDVGIVNINSPTTQIVSNDQIEVAIQVRNYGLEPVSELPVAYKVPGASQIEETIHFNPPLYNGDEYVYRFNQRFHSSFGAVNLKCWTGLEGDYYHDNDTVYKRLEGTGTTRDLEAKYITIDDADPDHISLQLAFMNRSSVGVGNITVGYYLGSDRENVVEETYRLGNVLPSGTYGYHKFEATLPRANAPYTRITAFVSVDDEVDRSNDTTSVLYMGYRDGVADSVFIEQTYEPDCKVQLTAHNGGTIGGTTQVRAHLVLNGDYANQIVEDFTWEYDEPNPDMLRYMTFSQRIPKSENGTYNVIAWLDYPYDADHRNDTTHAYAVRSYVGLEEVERTAGFVLEQNQPNPFTDETTIGFTLPESGEATLVITNNLGQVLKTIKGNYGEGRNTIVLKDLDLPEGIYHYTMYYKKDKQMRKMIISK